MLKYALTTAATWLWFVVAVFHLVSFIVVVNLEFLDSAEFVSSLLIYPRPDG